MKKALSLVLSVFMLLSGMATVLTIPVSADPLYTPVIELMDDSYILSGADNVTVNADGSWTVTGDFVLRCDINYNVDAVTHIKQHLTTNTPVKIRIYDQPFNQWISLYDYWVGGDFFPVGTYNENDSLLGIYNWMVHHGGWDPAAFVDGANVSAVYFEFDGATADTEMTLYDFYLNSNKVIHQNNHFGSAEFAYNTTFDLTFRDNPAVWSSTPVSDSRPVVNVTEDALTVGNTAGAWPSVYYDFDTPIIINEESMIYCDFDVNANAKTAIYLYFGQATCKEFDSGAYGSIHKEIGAELSPDTYRGYVTITDILPDDFYERQACYNVCGELILTGIRIYAVSSGTEAVDPAVTIRSLDLCYNKTDEIVIPEPILTVERGSSVETFMRSFPNYDAVNVYDANGHAVTSGSVATDMTAVFIKDGVEVVYSSLAVRGDLNGNANIDSADARKILLSVLGETDFSPAQWHAADYDQDGTILTIDARYLLIDLVDV